MLCFGHTIIPVFLCVYVQVCILFYTFQWTMGLAFLHTITHSVSKVPTEMIKKKKDFKIQAITAIENKPRSLQWVRKGEGFKSIGTKRYPGSGEVTAEVPGAQTPEIKPGFCRGVLQMIPATNLQISLRCWRIAFGRAGVSGTHSLFLWEKSNTRFEIIWTHTSAQEKK